MAFDIKKYIPEKYIRDVFDVGVVIKGIDGLLETVSGILLLFVKPSQLISFVGFIVQRELGEDPKDVIANYLLQAVHHSSINSIIFASFYLLTHGLIKIIIVVGLLKNKLWAYSLAITVFSAFSVYQIYRYTYSHSISLIIFTVFDIFIILLAWHEYGLVKKLVKVDNKR